jgi:hypothetical protein
MGNRLLDALVTMIALLALVGLIAAGIVWWVQK